MAVHHGKKRSKSLSELDLLIKDSNSQAQFKEEDIMTFATNNTTSTSSQEPDQESEKDKAMAEIMAMFDNMKKEVKTTVFTSMEEAFEKRFQPLTKEVSDIRTEMSDNAVKLAALEKSTKELEVKLTSMKVYTPPSLTEVATQTATMAGVAFITYTAVTAIYNRVIGNDSDD